MDWFYLCNSKSKIHTFWNLDRQLLPSAYGLGKQLSTQTPLGIYFALLIYIILAFNRCFALASTTKFFFWLWGPIFGAFTVLSPCSNNMWHTCLLAGQHCAPGVCWYEQMYGGCRSRVSHWSSVQFHCQNSWQDCVHERFCQRWNCKVCLIIVYSLITTGSHLPYSPLNTAWWAFLLVVSRNSYYSVFSC